MPFVDELLNFVNDVFVETGTFEGDTAYKIANNEICKPTKIISLELSDIFFTRCKKRFENSSNVILYKGNSKYDLYHTIKDINTKITFWLDSHWSGTPDVGCDSETICPILEELDQIKRHTIHSHTIIIDDICLMNNSDNKYNGFPVTRDQILSKIFEINPNYTIKYFNDYIASNNVLVACIEEKQCVHKYLTKCVTNTQPPGFADFLRGTICLYNFSKMYGYTLVIDSEHPLFQFLKNNKNIVYTNPMTQTEELIPPFSIDEIFLELNNMFNSGRSFSVMTNSFYESEGRFENFGAISEDCANYIKDILTPSIEVEVKLYNIFSTVYNLDIHDPFKIIHLRFGDDFIHNNTYDNDLYKLYYDKVYNLVNENKDEKYVLISDSSKMANNLKSDIQALLYWDNSKIHLGDLKNIQTSYILDTIVDFFIISKSNEIISIGDASGFSRINGVIHNIKYTHIDI